LYDGLLKGAKAPLRPIGQPTGTVTFLFTDIEGSTRLLDRLGDQYASVLSEHHEILRASVEKWNGREVGTQGDAFFVTFARALDAIQCAVEAQRALAAHDWINNERVRVRMGLHTGEPLIAATGYVGMDVHRAARIGDAGHGGQVLVSPTTRELVARDLPDGVTLRDLGEHRLKDLKYPAPIYQLSIDGLPTDFPPLKTKFTGTEAPTPGDAPFKGLQYFDESDSALFYGREILTAKLKDRLRDSQFLSVIIGASGSGKSSLVRAGLIPNLKKENANLKVHIITPTAHPLEALATELTRASESVTATATLIDDLTKDPRSLRLYFSRQNSAHDHTLLVIDQFEELFTLCRDEFEREAFIDNLLTAITPLALSGRGAGGEGQPDRSITLIVTLRADFYAHLAHYPELRDAVAQQQEYIGPMNTDELRRAIEEPARRGYWEFEPGLVDLILRDVGDEPGALPLLSHALLETWKRRAGHTLTLKGYADAGGVRGAIAHTAEGVYQNLSSDDQSIARNIFLRLTELGEGTEDTRRRASFDELTSHTDKPEQVQDVLNLLAQARLITLGEDTAEVAHEALIREWPTLREWLNQDREGLRLHRQLTEAAQEWEILERDPGAVYRGARLSQAREWAALHLTALNAQERAFLDGSNAVEEREAAERESQIQRELEAARKLVETQTRAAKQLRRRAIFLMVAFVLAIVLAGFALFLGNQSNQNAQAALSAQAAAQTNADAAQKSKVEADTQRDAAVKSQAEALAQQRIATARELAASSINSLAVDPERGILLALQAVNVSVQNNQPVLVEAQDALHRSIQASRVLATLKGHTSGVWSVAMSRDGKQMATIGGDGNAKVWDTETNQELSTLSTHADFALGGLGAAFTPDGAELLTVGGDNTAILWDLAAGKAIFTLSGHSALVLAVAISPDGKTFATASDDTTVKVWDAATGQEMKTLIGHEGDALVLAFGSDGKHIYAGSDGDGYAIAWDVQTGQEQFRFSGQGNVTGVDSIATSPDGTRIATGEFDTTIKVWESATGALLLTMFGHSSQVVGIAYSPDGKVIASASEDGTVRLWEAETGKALLTLSGHTSGVLGVAFSSDGNKLYTGSRDGTIKVWNVSQTAGSDWLNLAGHTNRVYSVAYRPDGKQLATLSNDGSVKVWDAVNGQELQTIALQNFLSAGNRVAGGISYSSDSKRLAFNDDQLVKIVDATSGAEILTLPPFKSPTVDVAFSYDGAQLAAAGQEGVIGIYDSGTGKLLLEFLASPAGIQRIAFSPDGKRIASANQDGTNVWDANTGQKLLTFSGHGDGVRSSGISFSPDGKWIASSGNDGNIKVWDSETGAEIFTLSGHTGSTFGTAFSADGQYLATSSVDRTVKVWKLPKPGEQVPEPLTLYGHTGAVYQTAFSPDGSRLASVGRNPIVRVYDLNIDDLIGVAQSRLTRSLTADECRKYLHVEQCPIAP
jgi:WD40 repeat protein/class 3 adenylate cyclase